MSKAISFSDLFSFSRNSRKSVHQWNCSAADSDQTKCRTSWLKEKLIGGTHCHKVCLQPLAQKALQGDQANSHKRWGPQGRLITLMVKQNLYVQRGTVRLWVLVAGGQGQNSRGRLLQSRPACVPSQEHLFSQWMIQYAGLDKIMPWSCCVLLFLFIRLYHLSRWPTLSQHRRKITLIT